MGRCVILLIAPLIIGVLIAAGVVVLGRLHQRLRRMDARHTLLRARRDALSPVDPNATEQSSDVMHRRIAA